MGMAASQARLLTITSRLHDVEFQAQSIQNAKTQLATQSDQVYQEYIDALNSETLTLKDNNNNLVVANFNVICGPNAVETANQYAILNEKGQVIVDDDFAADYNEYKENGGDLNDPYAFAMYILGGSLMGNVGGDFEDELANAKDAVAEDYVKNGGKIAAYKYSMDKILEKAEDGEYNNLTDEEKDDYDAIEKSYNYELFKHADEIYEYATKENDFSQSEFDYLVNTFKKVQAGGNGCIAISEYNGDMGGNAATDSDWLKQQFDSGKFSIEICDKDKKNGEFTFNTTSVSTDTYLSSTATSSVDSKALKIAEAKYEHDTKEIDAKDKKFDRDLSKLETERTALTTQYDSVKKVISDNIERTFGIFS